MVNLMMLTMASVAHLKAGDSEMANQRLSDAQRSIRNARLNGVDNSDLYYTQSGIHALRGEPQEAVTALQAAYDLGFRKHWVLEIDQRIDAIRNDPDYIVLEQQILDDVNRARAEIGSQQVASAW